MTSITVDVENTVYDSRGECNAIITKLSNALVVGCKNTVIPNDVEYIGNNAFYGCTGLTSIKIPESVWVIQPYAFYGCTDLNSITLPEGLEYINNYAFCDCTNLTSVTIPSTVQLIAEGAFFNCSSLTSVTVMSTTPINIYSEKTFSNRAYATLYVPYGSGAAYSDANYWKEFQNIVEIADPSQTPATGISLDQTSLTLTSAGQTATLTATVTPSDASNKEVTWTSSNTAVATVSSTGVVTAVANGTAVITATTADGTNLTAQCNVAVDIPVIINFADANVKALCVANWDTNGDGELSEAEAAAVTDLGTVFKRNNSITSFNELQYFTGLTNINNGAFYCCYGLTEVTIPNSVVNIGNDAFSVCIGLTEIIIPEGVQTIGESAFFNCNLQTVTIPSTVTSIGYDAFGDNEDLAEVYSFIEEPFDIYESVFEYESGNDHYYFTDADLYVPIGTKSKYLAADGWKKFGDWIYVMGGSTATVTTAPTAKTLTYTGSAQELVNAGTATGGTMQYSLNGGTYSTNIPTATNAGTYRVYYKVVGDDYHNNTTTMTVSVTINKAPLTVTAKSYTIGEGDDLPTFEADYSGFVNGETVSVLTTLPSFSCSATSTSAPGTYDIEASGAEAQNYTMTYINGTLTINRTKVSITMATSSGSPRAMKGYSNSYGLDFTGINDVKAYIAVGYTENKDVILARVYVVPANTGVVLRTDNPGVSADVPITTTDVYYANLLLPAVNNVTIQPTETVDGVSYTNLMVGTDSSTGQLGFVTFSSAVTRSNNCYLHVPTSFYQSAAAARQSGTLGMVFIDSESTDIQSLMHDGTAATGIYDLQGRKVTTAKKGLYIRNGKKYYVK